MPGVSKSVSDALEKLRKALDTVPDEASADPELEAYVVTAKFRQSLGEVFGASTVEMALGFLSDGSSTTAGTGISTPVSTQVEAVEDDSQKDPSASPQPVPSPQQSTEQPVGKPASDATSVAGSGSSIRRLSSSANLGKTAGEQITAILHQIGSGKDAMVVQDLKALLSYKELEELREKVLSVDTMKELDDKLEVWKNCIAQVKLLVGGISKSSQNLTTHLSNVARQVQREADKKRKQAETKEVAEAKKKAKAAAKKVKEQEISTPPIFKIGLDKLQETSLAPAMKDPVFCEVGILFNC